MKYLLQHIFLISAVLFPFIQDVHAATKKYQIGSLYYTLAGTDATVTYNTLQSGEYSGSIDIPSEVTYDGTTYTVVAIDLSAFNNCKQLTAVSIPNTVKSIGRSAFFQCTALASVVIPNSTTKIDESVFSGCTSLSTVRIGSGIKQIGSNAYLNCPLTSLTILATTPPTLGSKVFSSTSFTLTVPSGCKATYEADVSWSSITDIKEQGGGTKATSIAFPRAKRYVLTGKTIMQKPAIIPEECGDQSLTWSSSDNSIAKVGTDGTVTGVKSGSCTIKATTTDGSDITASYTVNVCTPGLIGDVNGDGDITIADANAIINIYLKE